MDEEILLLEEEYYVYYNIFEKEGVESYDEFEHEPMESSF